MRNVFGFSLLVLATLSPVSLAQNGDYGDYKGFGDDFGGPDNLYHDYAQRQQAKTVGGEGAGGLIKLVLSSAATWVLGAKYHSGRVAKKLKRKHQSEQKQLYSQYYNDVYKLSEQNQLLAVQVEELKQLVKSTEAKAELDQLQRDYDEFKQPDLDGDDRISRAEFNMYVQTYLGNYPGLSEKDYPVFEEFDVDGDGYVSFQEYSKQMSAIAAKAEREQMHSAGDKQKAKALDDLYRSSTSGNSGDLYRY